MLQSETVKKYDKYKDSGFEWIGEIPQAWNLEPLKMHSKIYGRIGFRGYTQEDLVDEGEGAITLSPTNIIDNTLTLEKSQYLSWNKYYESPEIMVDNGDILFVKTASVGKCAIYTSNELATINPQFVVFKNVTCNSQYLFYMLLSEVIQTPITLSNLGSVVGTIKQSELASYKIPIPSINEQQYIADYLDKKCGEIDRVVETEKSVIERLKEYKQSIITEAITKGLDKSVPLKDSGIEWIGKIPQHWEICKIKHVAEIKGRIGFKGYTIDDIADYEEIGSAIVLGGTNIMKEGYISYEKLTYLKEYKYLESPEIMLYGGEILITKVGAGTGDNAIYEFYKDRVTINPNVMLCVPKDTNTSHFINYYLLSHISKTEVMLESTKSGAQPAINQQFIKNHIIIFPPVIEQQQIVDYLDQKCSEIDKAIADEEQLIEKFTEYKKSLIYECVTGKRKVVA